MCKQCSRVYLHRRHSNSNTITAAVYIIYCFLTSGTCQDFAGCRESYFLYSGNCLPCPDHCITCISNTNCTKCTDNYYGVTCQHACLEQDCECHKKYGYCTYGCPDGRYPEEGSANCPICPDSCKLCSSSSDCVVCKPGFHGNTCEKTCPNQCESCNKTTGKCIICGEEYYNEDGKCLRCPERCVGCFSSDNCSSCRAGYLELNAGQCIKLCDWTERDSFPDVNEQNERDTLIHGGPAFGCMENLIGQDVVIRTRQPCIKYTSCPSTVPCLNCGAMMTYQCTHTCRLENEDFCSGKQDCNVVDGTMFSLAFCLTTKGAVSVNNITETSECVSEDVTTVTLPWIAVTAALMVVMVMVMLALLLWKWNCVKRHCSKWTLPPTSQTVEDIDESEAGQIPFLNINNDSKRKSDTSKHAPQATAELLKVDKEMQTDDQIASSDEVGDNMKNEGNTSSQYVGRGYIQTPRSQPPSTYKAPNRFRENRPSSTGQAPYPFLSSNRRTSGPTPRQSTPFR